MSWWVYILHCSDNSLYTGISTDPRHRLKQHNDGVGAKYTRNRRPVSIIYLEEQPSHSDALSREIAIKKLNHTQKLALAKAYEQNIFSG